MEEFEIQSRLFKALTNPSRLAILSVLRHGEECVCHIEAVLRLRQAYISQQLMVLREAGIVADRRDGWNIFYRVVEPKVFSVMDAMQELSSGKQNIHQGREVPSHCPCPRCNPDNSIPINCSEVDLLS